MKKPKTIQISFRVDSALVARLEKLRRHLTYIRGKSASRADVIREALVHGIEKLEEDTTLQ
jgi:predicted DNA-binding protein